MITELSAIDLIEAVMLAVLALALAWLVHVIRVRFARAEAFLDALRSELDGVGAGVRYRDVRVGQSYDGWAVLKVEQDSFTDRVKVRVTDGLGRTAVLCGRLDDPFTHVNPSQTGEGT